MPLKGNKFPQDVYKRIEALENHIKRVNTIEVYMKQVMQLEKQLGLMNRSDISKGENINTDSVKRLEKRLLLFVEETIKGQLEPLQKTVNNLSKRISNIEHRISTIEKLYSENMDTNETEIEDNKPNAKEWPVIYQEFKVEKLYIDKYEQVNNLGNLGIRELSGHLNIGTTFGNGAIPKELFTELIEELDKLKEKKVKQKDEQEQGMDSMDSKDIKEVPKN
ncbi:hypothetical protein [Neobacillus niacini]|uniref:hypothetical protein n=1 Tax=Neobacillus niacini TaxID=86668 RepID=UPI0005EEDE8E|nr:hypothetical protein [Neobacillus niacini]